MWQQIATVEYQIATYEGEIEIMCNEEDEDDLIIARAKNILKKTTSLPMYYERYTVKNRRDFN